MLEGKTAFVTGGTGAVGSAVVRVLAREGAAVAYSYHTGAEKAQRLDAELRAAGARVWSYPLEVLDGAASAALARQIERDAGAVDILVNNAGVTQVMPFALIEEDDWDRVMDVNVRSVFSLTNRVVRSMKETGGGRIVNTASLLSEIGVALIPAYAASKGAIRQLTKAWAVEWAKYNIRVNAIGPGYMRTEMTESLYHDVERYNKVMSRVAIKRWGTSEDVKGAVVFLASRASSYITGQVIYVDGGWLAG